MRKWVTNTDAFHYHWTAIQGHNFWHQVSKQLVPSAFLFKNWPPLHSSSKICIVHLHQYSCSLHGGRELIIWHCKFQCTAHHVYDLAVYFRKLYILHTQPTALNEPNLSVHNHIACTLAQHCCQLQCHCHAHNLQSALVCTFLVHNHCSKHCKMHSAISTPLHRILQWTFLAEWKRLAFFLPLL